MVVTKQNGSGRKDGLLVADTRQLPRFHGESPTQRVIGKKRSRLTFAVRLVFVIPDFERSAIVP
jgi:hypothetical protein